MHAQKLLHKLLKKSAVIGHEKRLNCLLQAVESVTHQGKLSLTSIGRHLSGTAKVKHKIKSVDNLLGNEQLMVEREGVYDLEAVWLNKMRYSFPLEKSVGELKGDIQAMQRITIGR